MLPLEGFVFRYHQFLGTLLKKYNLFQPARLDVQNVILLCTFYITH